MTDNKGDLISREALKNDLITFFPDRCLEGITTKTLFNQILTDINNAPTVLFPLTVNIKDNVTDEDKEVLKRLMKDYKPQVLNLETDRPQGEWIPVSERLPEYSGLYLISVDDLVTVANFTGNCFMNRGGRVEADAWQPLPEPHKKGGADMRIEKEGNEWICPDCDLYEQAEDDYCQYAGECTIGCHKCKYFKQKGGAE